MCAVRAIPSSFNASTKLEPYSSYFNKHSGSILFSARSPSFTKLCAALTKPSWQPTSPFPIASLPRDTISRKGARSKSPTASSIAVWNKCSMICFLFCGDCVITDGLARLGARGKQQSPVPPDTVRLYRRSAGVAPPISLLGMVARDLSINVSEKSWTCTDDCLGFSYLVSDLEDIAVAYLHKTNKIMTGDIYSQTSTRPANQRDRLLHGYKSWVLCGMVCISPLCVIFASHGHAHPNSGCAGSTQVMIAMFLC